MRHLLLVICAAAALTGAAACPAEAGDDEPLPEGSATHDAFPRLLPLSFDDEDAVRRWCESCLEHARTSRSAVRTADLLMSAGWVLGNTLGERERAAALLEEAAELYPPGEAPAGAAWLEAARLHLREGRLDAAERSLASARAYAGARAPVDSPETVLREWERLRRDLAGKTPEVAAALAEARGEHREAASELEATAGERAPVWARAARLRARAGDPEQALQDVDRALELVRKEERLAEWTMWRLYCAHGLLDEEGAPDLRAAWPGDAFVQDAYAALRRLQGNPHATTSLLSLGSRALLAGQPEASLGFYRIALSDPDLLEAARHDERLWRGLLAAFPVALRLGRFAEAQRILDVVEGTGQAPREEMDGYRVAVARAEEDAREPPPAEPEEPPVLQPPEHPDRGRLRPDAPEERAGRREPSRGPAERSPSLRPRVLGSAALIVLLLLVLYTVGRRRR